MRTLMRSLPFAVFLLALAQFVGAQAQQTFTPKSIVQFAQGGDRDFKASANCQAGTLTAVDGLQYTYIGTWPEGRGAGRPRFRGPHTTDGTTQFEQQGGPQVASGAWSIADVANGPGSGESLAMQWEILCAGAPVPPVHR